MAQQDVRDDYFIFGIASATVFPARNVPFPGTLEGARSSFKRVAFAFIARPSAQDTLEAASQRWLNVADQIGPSTETFPALSGRRGNYQTHTMAWDIITLWHSHSVVTSVQSDGKSTC
ncbi:hypothetical protein [Pararhizobium antarcticum]|uniref:hypothetical protein n=1 Tax=Pararhizobium antarcticum TaxID=1798805 RepID=UPI001587082B|nr:hypothetical protein [Pararhizobium antarcticum]